MTNAECIFCRIATGEIPATIVYQDDRIVAFEDAHPQAPAHLLVVPRRHYADVVELAAAGEPALTAALLAVAADLGYERGGPGGFRIVTNTGPDGGQTVGHLHLHVLAGRRMEWPPG